MSTAENIWRAIFRGSVSILALFLLGFFLFFYSMRGEDRGLETRFREGAKTASMVLTKHGICIDVEKCGGRVFFWEPLSNGFAVSIYGVTDKKILAEVNNAFAEKIFEDEKMKLLILIAYKDPKTGHVKQSEMLRVETRKNR